jgi:uncharacterized protein
MSNPGRIYTGTVIHHRLRPTPHKLQYQVFSLLLDLDQIEAACATSRLFSHNRFNLFAHYDRDHGSGTGEPLSAYARRLWADAEIDTRDCRVLLLAYPRCLGATFNPLSVYYCVGPDGVLRGLIYEVNNTFGARRSYVIAAGLAQNAGVYAQTCAKELFVSPFAPVEGHYGFRVTIPADELLLGVQYYDTAGAVLRTHFRATAAPLNDDTLRGLLRRYSVLMLKVVGGIHWEALKLWLKGVPLVHKPASARYAITNVPARLDVPAARSTTPPLPDQTTP